MRNFVCFLALLAGCGGGAAAYPKTDVPEPRGMGLLKAKLEHTTDNRIKSGTLEYKGQGSMQEVWRGYLTDLEKHGWQITAQEYVGERATATLKKDNRTISIEFTSASGSIHANVKVESGPPK